MALPSTGPISFSDINVELAVSATTQRSMDDAAVRTLFGIPSGAIDMNTGHGKANRVSLSYTFSVNTTETTITASSLPGYIAGKSDITITVNAGIYLYSTTTSTAALTITGANSGDVITLVNNGYIMGKGGDGAPYARGSAAGAGGPAISLGYNINVTNNSYIGGGGGGGGNCSGGGGAGGGRGSGTNSSGGAGGGPGSSGSSGAQQGSGRYSMQYGGGGGRIMPGSGAGQQGGGGAGGGGGHYNSLGSGGTGGSAGGAGGNGSGSVAGGGGGGWGAAGGSGVYFGGFPGAAGGKAIALNSYTVTYLTTGTIYGAVS